MKPTFLIIGAGKSGTTSLWAYLSEHPQIAMSQIKEPSFFSMDAQWERGSNWYERQFKADAGVIAAGEASNSYSALGIYPKTIDRIRDYLNDVRIIYCVRHPVARTESDWMEAQKSRTIDFSEFLRTDPVHQDKNCYGRTYDAYCKAFGGERMHLVIYDDLRSNPAEVVRGCLNFVGVNPDIELNVGTTHRASSAYNQLPPLVQRFKRIRAIETLSLMMPNAPKSALRKVMGRSRHIDRPVWKQEDYLTFREKFEGPTRIFLKQVGRDEAMWDWDRKFS